MWSALITGALFVTAGCAHRSSGGATVPAQTPEAMAHVDVRGVVELARDVPVKECYIGKPGTHLLNGYSVTLEGDSVVEGGEVLIPEFSGDGTYVEDAGKRTNRTPGMSWIMLNVARGPGFPHGTTLEERPDSRVAVTISGAGKNGTARFENYRSLYGRNGDEHGGAVTGTISWTCAQLARPSL